jgi:predicted ATPase with chaperone activity
MRSAPEGVGAQEFAGSRPAELPPEIDRPSTLAPRPKTLSETGLTSGYIAHLTLKHLLNAGNLTAAELAARIALPGRVLETVFGALRREAQIQLLANQDGSGAVRYALTDRGRATALDARMRDSYVGPAPVPLETYSDVVRRQTIHDRMVTRQAMHAAFRDVVLRTSTLDQLGPALNSGRAIFIHGPAGTGKTFVTQRLARLFPSDVLIPYAIEVNEATIAVFDPLLHRPIGRVGQPTELLLDQGHDARYVRCE